MKTKQKIIIDKLFGTPTVYLINTLARLLGLILKIDHRLDKPFDSIVIAKYIGLGSIIQATPLIQTLRIKFPNAKIIFLTTQGNKALINHIPEIDDTIIVSDKNILKVFFTTSKAIFQLWKVKPQIFIDLEFYSSYSSIVGTLSKATNRLGFSKQDLVFRKGVYNYLVPFDINTPISSSYLQFAKLLYCDNLITKLKISVDSSSYSDLKKILNISDAKKYIIINPNASDLRIERRWPKENYVNLINKLIINHLDYTLILIGDKTEMTYVNEIERMLNTKNIINSAGKLSLTQLITLISGAHLMITNDTGPMHIAYACNVKTISLFGPCSPLQYGGIESAIIFYKKVHCSPCVHQYLVPPCHGDNQCMKQITETEVYNSVNNILLNSI